MKIKWYLIDDSGEEEWDGGEWAKREDVEKLLYVNDKIKEQLLVLGGFEEWLEEIDPSEEASDE